MKPAVSSARRNDKTLLARANPEAGHELHFVEDRLTLSTAVFIVQLP